MGGKAVTPWANPLTRLVHALNWHFGKRPRQESNLRPTA